jgi:aspartate ammonia-lyase
MAQSVIPTRLEEDALGTRHIPDDLAYGIQTARVVDNFSISGRAIADIEGFVASIIAIKQAAARANRRTGGLDRRIAEAIEQAATEYARAIRREDFPVDIYHGGGGTAANMNVNEVLANRASEILSGRSPVWRHLGLHRSRADRTPDCPLQSGKKRLIRMPSMRSS